MGTIRVSCPFLVLIPFHGDADKLAFLGFVGDGGVGSGGDFFVVGRDSGLVSVDCNGDVSFRPGGVLKFAGEFDFVSEGIIDGGFDPQERDLEGCGVGVDFGESAFAVGAGGVSANGVFEEVGDAVVVGVGQEVAFGFRDRGEFFGDPGVEWIGRRIGNDDGTGDGDGFIEGEVLDVVGEGVGAGFGGDDSASDDDEGGDVIVRVVDGSGTSI